MKEVLLLVMAGLCKSPLMCAKPRSYKYVKIHKTKEIMSTLTKQLDFSLGFDVLLLHECTNQYI